MTRPVHLLSFGLICCHSRAGGDLEMPCPLPGVATIIHISQGS